ncbi:MAG: AmmeMemoRadiSam system protein A [Bacillota bacterium]
MRGVVFAGLCPHPPIMIPEIGGAEVKKVSKTVEAMEYLAQSVFRLAPGVILMVSPHARIGMDEMTLLDTSSVSGDLGRFGRPDVTIERPVCRDTLDLVEEAARAAGIGVARAPRGEGALDHGFLVPLYFLDKAGVTAPLVCFSMSLLPQENQVRFGRLLGEALDRLDTGSAFLASGDLSHRLTKNAPAGYSPRGREFDTYIVSALERTDLDALLNIDPGLVEAAGECGLRPLSMLAGLCAATGLNLDRLSYEGPFGVGYAVASFQKGDPLVALARRSLETYIRDGRRVALPKTGIPDARAGVFVSLKVGGELRGCIGTFAPTRPSIAEEIREMAIAAGTQDPRFPPVTASELSTLSYSVDVLSPPEAINDETALDPKVYGVIVEKGPKRGLLLPDLEGVDTVSEQLSIAKRKAGINPSDRDVRLYRFRVERHREGAR